MYLLGDDLLIEIFHLPLCQPVHLDVYGQVGLLLVQDYLPVGEELLFLKVHPPHLLPHRRLKHLVFIPPEVVLLGRRVAAFLGVNFGLPFGA